MLVHAWLALTALLAFSGASSDSGRRDPEVARAQPPELASIEQDDVCLLQSRRSLGTRRARGVANAVGGIGEDVTSFLQSSVGEDAAGSVVSHGQSKRSMDTGTGEVGSNAATSQIAIGQAAGSEDYGRNHAGSKVAGAESASRETAKTAAASSDAASGGVANSESLSSRVESSGAVNEAAGSEAERLVNEAAESDVARSDAASRTVTGGEAAIVEAARSEGERLGIQVVESEAARSEAAGGEVAGGELSSIEAAESVGERLGIEAAESEATSNETKVLGAELEAHYLHMQHAAGSLAELARSSVLGYQAASAAVGEKVICILAVIIGLSVGLMLLEKMRHHDELGCEQCQPEPLDEDAYGLAIESLIHNTALIATGNGRRCTWLSRLALTQGILFLNMALQMYLLQVILKLCAAVSVHDIREDYDKYEFHMYGGQERHTWLTDTGKHRGFGKYFDARNFDTLPETLKVSVCNTPFSQPLFFIVVICIWTLVCVREIKMIHDTYLSLIWNTARCDSMAHAHRSKPDGNELMQSMSPREVMNKRLNQWFIDSGTRQQVLIHQLTRPIKAYIHMFILGPRLVITCYLCYIGCRWLAATNSFTDLVLNSVALEFIMGLKDLLYVSLVPNRNKRDLRNTWVHPPYKQEPANFSHFLGTFLWLFVAVLWACVYTFHVQRVLPQYNWDVRNTCEQWLAEATKT